jgi:hypothetical protein
MTSQAQPPRPGLSTDARLALIAELERREARAVRRAAALAWVALGAAALLLVLLVFGAWSQLNRVRTEVSGLEAERRELAQRTEEQRAALGRIEDELQEKQEALSTLIGAVRRTDERARVGLGTALDADPRASGLVPRAYIHIAEEEDRRWARNLGDRLQTAGIIPLGVERVPSAARLQRFEVRYYKKAEEDVARRLVSVLEQAGVPAVPVYLNLETNTRVRQNHYEIWCPPNARAFKLAPVADPASRRPAVSRGVSSIVAPR